jgi:hypothetical protein
MGTQTKKNIIKGLAGQSWWHIRPKTASESEKWGKVK